jgi:hypothetical protein
MMWVREAHTEHRINSEPFSRSEKDAERRSYVREPISRCSRFVLTYESYKNST